MGEGGKCYYLYLPNNFNKSKLFQSYSQILNLNESQFYYSNRRVSRRSSVYGSWKRNSF